MIKQLKSMLLASIVGALNALLSKIRDTGQEAAERREKGMEPIHTAIHRHNPRDVYGAVYMALIDTPNEPTFELHVHGNKQAVRMLRKILDAELTLVDSGVGSLGEGDGFQKDAEMPLGETLREVPLGEDECGCATCTAERGAGDLGLGAHVIFMGDADDLPDALKQMLGIKK